MEDNIPKGTELLPQSSTQEDSKKSDSSLKKRLSETHDTNFIKRSVTDSNSFLKKESTQMKDMNSVKETDSVSSKIKGSTLKKTQRSSLISATSEFIASVNDPGSMKSPGHSLKSHLSGNRSLTQDKNSATQSVNAQKSVSFIRETPNIPSDHTHLTKNSLKKSFNSDEGYKDEKPSTLIKSDLTVATYKTNSSYVSPTKSSLACEPSLTQKSTQTNENKKDLKCIPPWAKSLRNMYGMMGLDPTEEIPEQNLQEKIKSLMEKHSRLMLVKRGESRKQVILEPSESGDLGTVKLSSKNTRYYMAPIPKEAEETFPRENPAASRLDEQISENKIKTSVMSVTKKTSRSQAKHEVSNVLKSLYNSRTHKEAENDRNNKVKTPLIKITPSKIREYVDAKAQDPGSEKLHEIIKIKKVPSHGVYADRKLSSKYIINVPRSSKDDGTTVNKITVKEKRKIRIDSAEDINENVTEIIYNHKGSKTKPDLGNQYITDKNVEQDIVPYSKRGKSPTKSRTLKVTSEATPIITDLISREKRAKDRTLLIQYEKTSKPCPGENEKQKPAFVSTQLLGIKQPCNELSKEMYLYGTETDGKKCKEQITKVDDVSPTLREKVNMIFQELREMTFKPCAELESSELRSSVSSKSVQYSSTKVETDAVSVQALPEVRSAEVQVHESMLFPQSESKLSKEEKVKDLESEQGDRKDITSTEIRGKSSSLVDSKKTDDLLSIHSTDKKEDKDEIPKTDTSEHHDGEISGKTEQSMEDTEIKEDLKTDDTDAKDLKDALEMDDSKVTSTLSDDRFHDATASEDQNELKVEDKLSPELLEEHSVDKETLKSEETGGPTSDRKQYDDDDHDDGDVRDDDVRLDDDDVQSHVKEEYEKSEGEGDKDEGEDGEYAAKKGEQDEEEEDYDSDDQYKGHKIHVIAEDIRSYEFDPAQDYELRMINSTKFFHQRDSLRKMNWSEDILYLENSTCPQLVKGLAEIAIRQPEDPISYLAHWIYKDYYNNERDEQHSIYKEHLEVTKGMIGTTKVDIPVCPKFKIRRYPMKTDSPEASTVGEEREEEEIEEEEIEAE